ncbi:MAG: hypothetical protein A3G64_01330 [Candidatus Liptonbacteria bacterium RIFCSPLOWO2_12_FULL_60_15]|uniref:Aminoacyl-tRNA hydrolase n=2 Tax=Candidatus Liptoniibacteriota TaxID=1817909 RepID=A0A1G2CQE7_9BACT|nr:MAG: hypothetical protein A3E09_00015 [Candidatus Liptonbacteria bacterium RIFCSPHIGHO2_12_FULL_60_13]OGZ02871.1 MAG: hypothetical protein A3G64_01330 [Candidatus Liptonbacteria bacterium RIFCSPLOWO2_12_FULL_60_15]
MSPAGTIRAFIGLGNAGEEFARTYHNAGFLFLDHAAEGAWIENKKLGASYQKRHGVLLVKPAGYMNESGRGAAAALRYFKISPAETAVVHDDSDLPLGTAKLVFGQSAAGHHGVESVIKAFGTCDFWRLKIGIRPSGRRAGRKRKKAGEFVLSAITKADRALLERLFQRASVAVMENVTPLSAFTIKESGKSAFSI